MESTPSIPSLRSTAPSPYGHPEIEGPDHASLQSVLRKNFGTIVTSVDLYELRRSETNTISATVNRKGLSHEQLVEHLNTSGQSQTAPAFRVLLLNDTELDEKTPKPRGSFDRVQVALNPLTVDYLIQTIGVSPIFFSTMMTIPWLLNTGNALLQTFDEEAHPSEVLSSAQGFFRFSVRGRPAHVWFKHNLMDNTATYIIQNCPKRVRANLSQNHILRPLALETLIIDEVAWNWSKGVVEAAEKLLLYEHLTPHQHVDGLLNSAVHDLHTLSQHFHIMQQELDGIVEQLDYLVDVHRLIMFSGTAQPKTTVADSLLFLRSRTRNWHRWVHNCQERTNIRINLFFNLATQRDNRTNLKIADLTTKIATETQKDSSSMITIAALTLLFLPGTFVAAIFSMPFFQTSSPESGAHLSVAHSWWLFPAITIPFTILVIGIWSLWRMWRDKRQNLDLFANPTEPDISIEDIKVTIPIPRSETLGRRGASDRGTISDARSTFSWAPLSQSFTRKGGPTRKLSKRTASNLSPLPRSPPAEEIDPTSPPPQRRPDLYPPRSDVRDQEPIPLLNPLYPNRGDTGPPPRGRVNFSLPEPSSSRSTNLLKSLFSRLKDASIGATTDPDPNTGETHGRDRSPTRQSTTGSMSGAQSTAGLSRATQQSGISEMSTRTIFDSSAPNFVGHGMWAPGAGGRQIEYTRYEAPPELPPSYLERQGNRYAALPEL